MTWNNSFRQREKTFDEKFWEKANICESDECWEWTAARNKKGYGNFYMSVGNSKSMHVLAHRVAYMLANDVQIPEGMLVCHTCDNPPCVNPKHLFLGTDTDNMQDMMKKGRSAVQRGFKAHLKLDKEKITEIRKLRSDGVMVKDIASMFGIDLSWVSKIVNNRKRTE